MAGVSNHAQLLIYSRHFNILTKSWRQVFSFSFSSHVPHTNICSFCHRGVLQSPVPFFPGANPNSQRYPLFFVDSKIFPSYEGFYFSQKLPQKSDFLFWKQIQHSYPSTGLSSPSISPAHCSPSFSTSSSQAILPCSALPPFSTTLDSLPTGESIPQIRVLTYQYLFLLYDHCIKFVPT